MVENLIDELDGRLLRVTIAYPGLTNEVRKARKHTQHAIRDTVDRHGEPINLRKILKHAIKASLLLVQRYPELKQELKPIIRKSVLYLEPQNASSNQH